ncbi:MAG: hypothetical protein HZB92_06530 [Euryarchaeota archaeon]|nr:hypothetical protein [Euryarchaeota archaeon]
MTEYTTVKISRETMQWINRLKGTMGFVSGMTMSTDMAILAAVQMADWQISVKNKLTDKDFEGHINEVQKRLSDYADLSKIQQMMQEAGLIQ